MARNVTCQPCAKAARLWITAMVTELLHQHGNACLGLDDPLYHAWVQGQTRGGSRHDETLAGGYPIVIAGI